MIHFETINGVNMTAINEVTNLEIESNIAVLTLNSPPVNALSANVREGLHVGVKQAIEDESVKAIVLICEGRTFIAGADITEFGQAPKGPSLFDVQDMIEESPKPRDDAVGQAVGAPDERAFGADPVPGHADAAGELRELGNVGVPLVDAVEAVLR